MSKKDICLESLSANMYKKKNKKVLIFGEDVECKLEVLEEESMSKEEKKLEKEAERELAKEVRKKEKEEKKLEKEAERYEARELAKEARKKEKEEKKLEKEAERYKERELAKEAKKQEKEAAKKERKKMRKNKKLQEGLPENIIQIEVEDSLKECVDRFHRTNERAPNLDELNNMFKEIYG